MPTRLSASGRASSPFSSTSTLRRCSTWLLTETSNAPHGPKLERRAVTASEILVSVAVLRPWSYRRSWGRSLALAVVLAPWMLLWGGFGMHAGPTTHAHTLWLFFYWVGLLAAAVTSGVSSARAGWASMIDAA